MNLDKYDRYVNRTLRYYNPAESFYLYDSK